MAKLKTFNVAYRAEVLRLATVEAESESEAREKFNDGDFEEGDEIECSEVELVELVEEEYD